jgi:hypothetical protein
LEGGRVAAPHSPPPSRGDFALVYGIEECRAASKSHHYKFGCFLSISQRAASADITKNSAVGKNYAIFESNIFKVLEKDLNNVSERKLPI